MTLNFVTIPYFIEIISLSGLGFVIIGLHRGVIGVRKIFLIGFVLTGLSSIILFIAEIKFREFFLTALLDLCFVGLKFYCLYLLYNKTTNGWYRAYVKSLKSDK